MNDDECMDGYFTNSFCGNLQHKLWNLLENPNSSFAAKVYTYLEYFFSYRTGILKMKKITNTFLFHFFIDCCSVIVSFCCSLYFLIDNFNSANVSGILWGWFKASRKLITKQKLFIFSTILKRFFFSNQ